ncbi:autotransporter-associated beta strand repeat-containing protein [Luteolibacter ambystomatis]|uniref:Autotransporter-associated beta strand repeat-containing protein n=1 Tax=Luteolibacter ambystomatis TaxID=2824561 RepID=A0A975PGB5_9BACT|nr:autotransporter-associated beta strand repeat-containing protein [Luteolibacter ambystomatis]QUE52121.1 autotransporter-associated beta strand repeat-containing protein [Luteolibacter ambystomatis]
MKPCSPRFLSTRIMLAASVLSWPLAATHVSAANVWDGGGDGNWGTGANWDDDNVPSFPVGITFGGTGGLASTNNLTGITVNGITFASGAGAFVIGGNSFSLGGNIVNNSASLQTINNAIALTANRTVNTATGDITLGGAITGSFGLIKTGAGKLTLSGTGGTSQLAVGDGAAGGTAELSGGAWTQAGTITNMGLVVGNGAGSSGALTISGGTHTFGGDNYSNAVRIGTTTAAGQTANGSLTITGGLVKVGTTGTLDAAVNLGTQISGGGTSTGTLNISGGEMQIAGRLLMGANNAANTATVTLSGTGVLNMTRTGSTSDRGQIRMGAGASTVNFNGGTYIASGLYSSDSSTTSNVYFNGSEIRANASGGSFGNGGTANFRIETGGLVFNTNGFDTTIGTALKNSLTTTGAFTKNGNGQLSLTAANTYTGTTTVNGGTLRFANSGSLGANAAVVMQAGTTLRFDRNDTFGDATSVPTVTVTANNGATITNGNFFNNLSSVTLNGSSLVSNGGANANYQAFKLSGTVTATGSSGISVSGSPGNANTQIHLGGNAANSQTTFSVTGVADSLSVSAVLRNGVTGGSGAVVTAGLIKTGAGTMTLSGVNTYGGATSINQGKLALGGSGSIAASTTINIASGAFLDVSGTSSTWSLGSGQTLTGNGTVTGNATISGTVAAGNSIGALAFSNTLTLLGTVNAELDASLVTADLVTAGNIAFGGTLNAANLGGTLDQGQTYNLFDFTSASGAFDTVNLPTLTNGLSWDTSSLYTQGTISIVPEPTAAFALPMGLTLLLGVRRRHCIL